MSVVNRVLAVVLGLVLLVGGLLVAAEVLWVLAAGGDEPLLLPYTGAAERLSTVTWDARPAVTVFVVLVVVGLLLLVLEGRRRQPGLVLLASSSDTVRSGVDRRTLHRAAANAAADVDGISGARAAVSGRRLRVEATAGIRNTEGLQDRLRVHMQEWVEQLGLAVAPDTSVRLREGRQR